MTEGFVIDVFTTAVTLALKLAAPMLIISMSIGLIIAILQAATQVHEQTLTFAPKAIIVALVLLLTGPWMIQNCIDFINNIFDLMASVE